MSDRCEWHLDELTTYSPVGLVVKREEKVWLIRDSFDILVVVRRFFMAALLSWLFLGEATESDRRPPVVVTPSSSTPMQLLLLQLTSRAGGMSTILSFMGICC